MAKKRRREEEPSFEPPEFDEVRYMRKEVEGAKAAVIALLLAVALAVVSDLLYRAALAPLGFLIILLAPFVLRWIYPALGVDTTLLDRRTWAAMIVILIMAWISIWIILLNPPFMDHTPPVLKQVRVEGSAGQVVIVSSPGQRVTLGNTTAATVLAFLPDNERVTATFDLTYDNGTTRSLPASCNPPDPCGVVVPGGAGTTVAVRISAVDANGNRMVQDFSFTLVFAG